MQPLKRFTQCGSLTIFFGVFIVLFGVSSTGLTTFGKTNTQPPPTNPPVLKGRECSSHDDCSAIERSSCVRDNEYKMRCLCGDDTVPLSNSCPDTLKGLRHRCGANNDCEDGMVCQFENNNRTIGVSKFISSKTKICLCDNDNGYVEDTVHDVCSGVNLQVLANIFVTIGSLLAPFLFSAHMNVKKNF